MAVSFTEVFSVCQRGLWPWVGEGDPSCEGRECDRGASPLVRLPHTPTPRTSCHSTFVGRDDKEVTTRNKEESGLPQLPSSDPLQLRVCYYPGLGKSPSLPPFLPPCMREDTTPCPYWAHLQNVYDVLIVSFRFPDQFVRPVVARAVNGLTRTVSFPGHVSVPDSVNPSIDHFQQDHIHDLCNNVVDNDIIVWTLVFDFRLDYKKFVPYRLTLKFNVNSTLRYICQERIRTGNQSKSV